MRHIGRANEFVRPSSSNERSITVYDGRTGSGKSKRLKENVLIETGRHLLVVPRKQSIRECYDDLAEARELARLNYPILRFLRDDQRRYQTNIATQIMDCAAQYGRPTDHCCLICTQAAFQLLDLDRFAGWHLKLDELPGNSNLSGSLHAPIVWSALGKLFAIAPLSERDRAKGIPAGLNRLVLAEEVVAADVMAELFSE